MKSPQTLIISITIALLLFGLLVLRVAQIDEQDDPADPATAIERAEIANADTTDTHRVPTGDDYLSEALDPTLFDTFTLTSTRDGDAFALLAPDRITVLYYGFTTCPDVCPTTLHNLRVALERLGNPPPEQVAVVMVTVDPARDTPAQLKTYVERFSEDFIGLYGDEAALTTAYAAFDATFERVALPESALGYTIDHTADVFLIAPGMAEVRRFYHSASASNYAHDLQLMLDAYAFELNASAFIPDAPTPIDFTLQSTQDDADFVLSAQVQVTVLYYGFTSCPDVCPTTLFELKRALDLIEGAAAIQVAMVTVDPERDTGPILREYMSRFDEDFIGLYGSREQIDAALDVFNVYAFKREFENSAMAYTYDHTADVFVVAPGGAYRLRIPYGTPHTAIAADLELLLATLQR